MEKFVEILKHKGIIGFPTETVYGIAADACCDESVAKIYEIKKRPKINPLIIHVSCLDEAKKYGFFDSKAEKLAMHFWCPSQSASSLTIVVPLKAESGISKLALAGLSTVALRVPNHPKAIELLRKFGGPLAIPSANISKCLTPTSVGHVRSYFPDLPILDGGDCQVGIESTIVDCSGQDIVLLREGIVAKNQLENVLDEKMGIYKGSKVKSPGMLKKTLCT